jgi:adenylate kinase
MKIVILGGPGSGKKTQTGLLSDHYRLTVLTIGELVKQAMAEESERGLQLRLEHESGQTVGDDVVLNLLQQRLLQPDLESGFILDGFPRNLLQALTLDELLGELGLSLDFVLLFEIETDALMERLVGRRTCRSCGAVYNIYTHPTAVEDVCDLCGGRLHQRADDTEETVSSRLHVFDHLTGPLLSHYGKQGKVLRIDGEGEVEEVFSRTCRQIDTFLAELADREQTIESPPSPPVETVAEPAVEPYQPQPEATTGLAPADPTQAGNEAKPAAGETAEQKPPAKRAPAEKRSPASAATKAKQTASPRSGSKRSPATQAAAKKGVAAHKQTTVKKTSGTKAVKTAAGGGEKTKSKPASKGGAVKKAAKKAIQARKPVAKKVVKKKAVAKKAVTGKTKAASPSKPRTAKKAAKKPLAKKSRVSAKTRAKAKPAVKKKVAKKQVVKRPVARKPAAKRGAAKSAVKNKGAGKAKAVPKKVNKKTAKKGSKGASARR